MNQNFKGLIFGILGAVAIMFSIVVFINQDLSQQNRITMHANYKVISEEFQNFQTGQETLIRMLAEHPAVQEFLLSSSAEAFASAESIFYYTTKANQHIMQIRLLSLDGMERIRIDQTDGNTLVKIQGKKLQNKSARDYFTQFNALSKDKIGYSQLNLNEEYGKVETPWKPTLRIGMPVFKDGNKIGLVVINFDMSPFLKYVQSHSHTQLTLIDSMGYYILHPNPQYDWSRYRNPSFKDTLFYPQWQERKLDTPFYEGTSSVYPITLFNGEKMLTVFTPKISPLEQFKLKALQFTLAGVVAILMILLPTVLIIRNMIATLTAEKTKLDEQNAFLDSILENSFDAKIIIDEKAIIKRVNKAARILLSYKDDELVGQSIKMLVPEPDQSLFDAYVRHHRNMKSKIIGKGRNLHARDKNGTLIPITLAVTPIQLQKGLFFIGTIRDLSQIVELKSQQREQEILMNQDKLASMGEMISAISHQWRQPLNSIGLIAQEIFYLHEDGALDNESMKRNKDDIMAQIQYMSQTIDDFRHFFTQGKELSSFNAISLVQELERLYTPQLKAHALSIQLLCPQKENVTCPDINDETYQLYDMTGYSSELTHVLINLLSNAKDAILNIKECTGEQRCITIGITLEEDMIAFMVSDLAGGISSETVSRLFEPYFTTKEMGTGLGLHIAKTITEKFFKGSLEYVDNIQGNTKGSTFILKMPKYIGENKK